MVRVSAIAIALSCLLVALPAGARTVYRCVQGRTVSLATAPEPGSRCEAREVADDAVKLPDLWGELGVVSGTLYERMQDGVLVYSTRKLPGSTKVLAFTVRTPEPAAAAEPEAAPALAAADPGIVGTPRVDRFVPEFRNAARRTGVDEAWLRAIAHAESGFDPLAVSPKGALGVMQLMPATAREQGVADPMSPAQSIDGGARYLRLLMRRYGGDLRLVAAAYNAGMGAVARYGGIPPFGETRRYIARVLALHARYRAALGLAPASVGAERLRPAK